MDVSQAERPKGQDGNYAIAEGAYHFENIEGLQSPELGSLPFELRYEFLAVFTPRRLSLLVENQITGVQTIPFKREAL